MGRWNTRSPLSRAAGLGSSRSGVEAWWAERVSAVALIPLTLWFAASIIAHTGSDYAALVAWLKTPVPAILMILLLIVLFHHAALGLQVVIGDYMHAGSKGRHADRSASVLPCAGGRRNCRHTSHRFQRLNSARPGTGTGQSRAAEAARLETWRPTG